MSIPTRISPSHKRPSRSGSPSRPAFDLIAESDLVQSLSQHLSLPLGPSSHNRGNDLTSRTRSIRQGRNGSRTQDTRKLTGNSNVHNEARHSDERVTPLSPIDALASAAVHASTPTFAANGAPSQLPNTYSNSSNAWTSPRPANRQSHPEERPAKRARSEVLPSPQIPSSHRFDGTARPYTSYNHTGGLSYNLVQSIETGQRLGHEDTNKVNGIQPAPLPAGQDQRLSDAELLLGFSRAANYSSPAAERPTSSGISQMNIDPRYSVVLPPNPYAAPETHHTASTDSSRSKPPQLVDGSAVTNAATESSTTAATASPRALSPHSSLQTHTPPEEPSVVARLVLPKDIATSRQIEKMDIDTGSQTLQQDQEIVQGQTPLDRVEQLRTSESLANEAAHPNAEVQLRSPQSLATDGKNTPSPNELAYHVLSALPEIDVAIVAKPPTVEEVLAVLGKSIVPHPEIQAVPVVETVSDMPAPVPRATKPRKPKEDITKCAACEWEHGSFSSGEYVNWLQCNGCKLWFHLQCAGFTLREVRKVDKYYCTKCRPKFGKTTFVRKSSRTTTSVDYAGLNEGVLRLSDETPEHHYIRPIKDGSITFDPENFPRMRPEELTAEYFEGCAAISEPILIPAYLNPPPYRETESKTSLTGHSPSEEGVIDPAYDLPEDSPYEQEMVQDNGQDKLGMIIPRGLTVRRVAQLHGPEMPLEVIDVKNQEGDHSKKWTVGKWADYYESTGEKKIRNVISLEVSRSPLGRMIQRPKVVRDLDLQDAVWPESDEKRVSVGFYCLMSVADSFTDFHIDFGGSSVYYHIVRGRKTFFFIPPTKSNLKKYEDWCRNRAQASIFLPDSTKECYRVDLSPGDTMIIPSGWIHAVWTPEDSLVIGGNFLTRLHYSMQLRIAEIERNTKVGAKFKYPYFQKVLWYTVLQYLEHDPLPESVRQLFFSGKWFERTAATYLSDMTNEQPSEERQHSRRYAKTELEGLPDLLNYILRTVVIHLDRLDGVSQDTRKAVSRSIPKKIGDALETAKDFAMWIAWKRGNEYVPLWAHPNGKGILPLKSEDEAMDKVKRMTVAEMKKLEKQAPVEDYQTPTLQQDLPETLPVESEIPPTLAEENTDDPRVDLEHDQDQDQDTSAYLADVMDYCASDDAFPSSTPKTSVLGPRRTACDVCRKRKMRCKHMGDPNSPSANSKVLAAAISQQHPSQSEHVAEAEPSRHDPVFAVDTPESRKGRSKACSECRRSKRRCIHDENGNVDPVKQAEPAVPRGSVVSKKRKSSASTADIDALHKRIKTETGQQLENFSMGLPDLTDHIMGENHFIAPVAPMFLISQGLSDADNNHRDENGPVDFSDFINLEHSSPTTAGAPAAVGPNGVGKVVRSSDAQGSEDDRGQAGYPQEAAPSLVGQGQSSTSLDEVIDPSLEDYSISIPLKEATPINPAPTKASSEAVDLVDPDLETPQMTNGVTTNGNVNSHKFAARSRESSLLSEAPTEHLENGDINTENATRHSNRQIRPVDRFAPPTAIAVSPSRNREEIPHARRATTSPEVRKNSRADFLGSGRRASLSVKPFLAKLSASSGAEDEEVIVSDPSLRLAMELQAEEFGLRRRRS